MISSMELIVIQKKENGILSGPYENDFEFIYDKVCYRVKIEQHLKRKIRIATDQIVDCTVIFDMETFIEQLLFLFDGRFYPIYEKYMIDMNENPDKFQLQVKQYYDNRHPIYSSIDILRYPFMRLVNFKDVDFEKTITIWSRISEELDIAYPMLLYCLSDIKLPIDCKIASIIEFAKPFGELVEREIDDFKLIKTNGRITLKNALESLIEHFGVIIFDYEIKHGLENFLEKMVNTRNKISHVKSLQNKECLTGSQCLLYLAKLTIMYRKIIFIIIGIDERHFSDNIAHAVRILDQWNVENDITT